MAMDAKSRKQIKLAITGVSGLYFILITAAPAMASAIVGASPLVPVLLGLGSLGVAYMISKNQ